MEEKKEFTIIKTEDENTTENKAYKPKKHKVKKQSLSYDEYNEYRNWVCSFIINVEDSTVNMSYLNFINQFAFAKFYLDVDIPDIKTLFDHYDEVCDIDPYDYLEFINQVQYLMLYDEIVDFCKEIKEEYNKEYGIGEFLEDVYGLIENTINNTMESLTETDINNVMEHLDKYSDLIGKKITIDDFIEHLKDEDIEEEIDTSKDDKKLN
ncbi:hypothetical protein [uncultured Thomasclavelia sp.]|uniref:hypothetical protein n=1 Tax=uncultured Thomasclavelia sp. TaxID=3025759 RepID=UPI00263771CC|nr:hypothetical protein [uncultured Thomasclavelia sp.]